MHRIWLVIAVAALACSPLARAQTAEEAIRAQIEAFTSAFNAGDAQAVGALYTEDAMILPPGEQIVEGREKIAEFWQGAIDSGFADAVFTPVEIVVVGDTAYETTTFTATTRGEGDARQPVAGKYVVVWQKGGDGAWRLHRDIWNLNAPE